MRQRSRDRLSGMLAEHEDTLLPLPSGIRLLRTLRGHEDEVGRIAWSPDGQILATPSEDESIRIWSTETGQCLRLLKGHNNSVRAVAFDPTGTSLAVATLNHGVLWDARSGQLLRSLQEPSGSLRSVAFDPTGSILATAGSDEPVKLWEAASGRLLRSLEAYFEGVNSVAFDPTGHTLATASTDMLVRLWDVASGKVLQTLEEHSGAVYSVAFDITGKTLATASGDKTVKLWDAASGQLLRSLEGHTHGVKCVAFFPDGRLIASKGFRGDSTIRFWRCDTGLCVATIPEPASQYWPPGLAFHPQRPLLATVGSDPGTPEYEADRVIHLWELDIDLLLTQVAESEVTYSTAKIVLVGDSGVGKTGLGWRLAHGEFKEHSSTHGQEFWVLDQLSTRRAGDTLREAVLWDLAGQPDYRLIHALFLDDADLALVLFDATDTRDPLHGVEFWLNQLRVGGSGFVSLGDTLCQLADGETPTLLVAARCDRGTATLTDEELRVFCNQRGILGFFNTSAKEGDGLDELTERMNALIPWEAKPATVTTTTFKRIKDYVLGLKEDASQQQLLVSLSDLRGRLEMLDKSLRFSDAEMVAAVGHLEKHGYVNRLQTSRGEMRILLAPELINNLAASFILEARRNPKGLGSLEEERLLSGEYSFRELWGFAEDEREILLDAAALMFLKHNVCFRETSPLTSVSYLVFPDLINLKRPIVEDEERTEDGVSYAVTGAVENVYASLVVLLGYTQTFTRTNQWCNHARYEVGSGLVCGFYLDTERDGELEFVLYFGTEVVEPFRTLFQSLFESFLARRNLTVYRYEPVMCANGHPFSRDVVRKQLHQGVDFAFCPRCGERTDLPNADEPIQSERVQQADVEMQRRVANQRSRFEQAVFRVRTYAKKKKIGAPACFISYAWGEGEHERWVERLLATDLQKAGVEVLLDRWENAKFGKSVPRFVERIEKSDRVIVVGTERYRHKYDNDEAMGGFVVAAEGDLIGKRMIGKEDQKESVLPVLLDGSEETSFPPLLHGRVYADFRQQKNYFMTAFDLILSLYEIQFHDPAVADLRESFRNFY